MFSLEWKEVPFKFEDGDLVVVQGALKSGSGVVIDTAFFDYEQVEARAQRFAEGKGGELSYHLKAFEPFPQMGVRFEDGVKVHYNADDMIEGKITLVHRPSNPDTRYNTVAVNPFSGEIFDSTTPAL